MEYNEIICNGLYKILAKKLARKHGYDVETNNYDQTVDFMLTPKKGRK